MYKFAFTYLVKQDKKTWNQFENSLQLLYKNILTKLQCRFKILIFCEGRPNKKVISLIKYLSDQNVEIIIKNITLKSYVKRKDSFFYKEDFPHVSDCTKTFSLGYRDMCKFFAIDVFKDKLLKDTEYFVRVDTDSFFLDVRKSFIKGLENINSDYAYINGTIQYEDKGVALGFGNCLYDFCKNKKKKTEISEDYLKICQEATLKPKLFYTNFEVLKLDWIKNETYLKLQEYIIKKEGIYIFRWGDALIRYYSIKVLNGKSIALNGCLYKHSGTYDSRAFSRRIFSKIYSKIRRTSHKNEYELNISKLDKIFLSIS